MSQLKHLNFTKISHFKNKKNSGEWAWPLPQTPLQWRWGHPLTTPLASRRLKSEPSPLRISGYATLRGWEGQLDP